MSSALAAAASDWLTYKKQRKDKLTDIGIQKLMTQIRNAASEYGEDRVIQVINKSMGAGYQGIVWDWLKNKSSPKPVNTFPSRRYDFAALERGDMASG